MGNQSSAQSSGAADPVYSLQPRSYTADARDPTLPQGWKQQMDSSRGRYFYYRVDGRGNAIPGSSTWQRPPFQQQMESSPSQLTQYQSGVPAEAEHRIAKHGMSESVTKKPARRRGNRKKRSSKQGESQDARPNAKQAQKQSVKHVDDDLDRLREEDFDDVLHFYLDHESALERLREEHPGLDDDALDNLREAELIADAEEFAGECYNSD